MVSAANLDNCFRRLVLEDGISHPCELMLRTVVEQGDFKTIRDWVVKSNSPSFSADVLRCLGRLEKPGTKLWRSRLLRKALANDDILIRDAAVSAAESWEEYGALRKHKEDQPWLKKYIEELTKV